MPETKTSERNRLTIDFTPYPDVERMLERVKKDRVGVPMVRLIVDSLRRDLTKHGYARKKDIEAQEAA